MNNMVLYIHLFSHKECNFHDIPPSSWPRIILAPHWVMIFSGSEKWIIQQLGRTPQPSSMRREFLTHFKIRRRLRKRISWINLYMTLFKNLDQTRYIIEQNRIQQELKKRWKMWKILSRKIQESRSGYLHDKFLALTPHCGESWEKILAKKFYRYASVQPLSDAQKSQRSSFCQWILE